MLFLFLLDLDPDNVCRLRVIADYFKRLSFLDLF
jgi:hypothetical protein